MLTAPSLPGTFFQEKNTLIVSDSLGRDLCHIYKADIISRPGCNIQALQRTLNQINLAKYSGLIIIIGTNDLSGHGATGRGRTGDCADRCRQSFQDHA